jgi:hypothetical protein
MTPAAPVSESYQSRPFRLRHRQRLSNELSPSDARDSGRRVLPNWREGEAGKKRSRSAFIGTILRVKRGRVLVRIIPAMRDLGNVVGACRSRFARIPCNASASAFTLASVSPEGSARPCGVAVAGRDDVVGRDSPHSSFLDTGVVRACQLGVEMVGQPHGFRCAQIVLDRAKAAGLSGWEVVHDIHKRCGVSLLRAHRLSRDLTLQQAAEDLRSVYEAVWGVRPLVSHQRMSQWEIGSEVPSSRYLDALCRMYRSRPDRLGFGQDYSEDSDGKRTEDRSSAPSADGVGIVAGAAHGRSPGGPTIDTHTSGELFSVRRRAFLRSLAASGGIAVSAELFETMRAVRACADAALELSTSSAAGIEDWEELAHEYGYLQLTVPLHTFLIDATWDFAQLQRTLAQSQPLEAQKRLYRVTAQLAGLIATSVNATGDIRETRAWFRTARVAADEVGDRRLRAWVCAYEGMSYLWHGRPAQQAIRLAQTAQALAGQTPSAAGALACAIEARGQSRLNRDQDALSAIRRSERMFDALGSSDTDNNVLGFYEQLLRFYQGNTLTFLHDPKGAMAAQDRAIELTSGDGIDPALIRLDRASCLIQLGELEQGCRVATNALLQLPPASRSGTALFRAREIQTQIPPQYSRVGAVHRLRDVIRMNSTKLMPLPTPPAT